MAIATKDGFPFYQDIECFDIADPRFDPLAAFKAHCFWAFNRNRDGGKRDCGNGGIYVVPDSITEWLYCRPDHRRMCGEKINKEDIRRTSAEYLQVWISCKFIRQSLNDERRFIIDQQHWWGA